MEPEAEKRGKLWRLGEALLFIAAAVAVAAYFHSLSPRVADPDSLYHFRHAQLYAARGPGMTEFPWMVYSVISADRGDVWYGFHILLAPLAQTFNSPEGLNVCGVVLTTAFLLLLGWAARRMKVACPYLCPFAVLLGSPMLALKWLSVRPQTISYPVCALLVSYVYTGGGYAAVACGFIVAWVHESFSLTVVPIVLLTAVVRRRAEGVWAWRECLGAGAGLVLGWLLRPNPIGAARIAWVHTFYLASVLRQHIPLSFSLELHPVSVARLWWLCGGLLIAWLAALLLFGVVYPGARRALARRQLTVVWSTLALSLLFFGMSLTISARAIEPWAIFSVLFAAAAVAVLLRTSAAVAPGSIQDVRIYAALAAFLLFGITALTTYTETGPALEHGVTDPNRLRTAMLWLRAHSRPGDIVFTPGWDVFPEMFFWDQRNRYINGMDPIFMYRYDPSLYWMAHNLREGGGTAYTSASPPSDTSGEPVDTYTALTERFHASYLLLLKSQTPALIAYALRDSRYRPVFECDSAVVFALAGTAAE